MVPSNHMLQFWQLTTACMGKLASSKEGGGGDDDLKCGFDCLFLCHMSLSKRYILW